MKSPISSNLILILFSCSMLCYILVKNTTDVFYISFLLITVLLNIFISIIFYSLPNSIWYKRVLIHKYLGKIISVSFNAYDKDLKTYKITTKAIVADYEITINKNIVFKARFENETYFYFTLELFSKNIFLTDRFGKLYSVDDMMLETDRANFLKRYKDILKFKNHLSDLIETEVQTTAWTIDPNSFNIGKEK